MKTRQKSREAGLQGFCPIAPIEDTAVQAEAPRRNGGPERAATQGEPPPSCETAPTPLQTRNRPETAPVGTETRHDRSVTTDRRTTAAPSGTIAAAARRATPRRHAPGLSRGAGANLSTGNGCPKCGSADARFCADRLCPIGIRARLLAAVGPITLTVWDGERGTRPMTAAEYVEPIAELVERVRARPPWELA